MKAIVAGLVLCFVGCIISRRSTDLECATTADCTHLGGSHVCSGGYCIVDVAPTCPAACTSCDATTNTCAITCTTAGACGAVTCPAGYNCDITCSAAAACGNITCAAERCRVTCTGAAACGNIKCDKACACDVTCAAGACGTETCPGNGANACVNGTSCDSTVKASCDSC